MTGDPRPNQKKTVKDTDIVLIVFQLEEKSIDAEFALANQYLDQVEKHIGKDVCKIILLCQAKKLTVPADKLAKLAKFDCVLDTTVKDLALKDYSEEQ